MIWISLGIFIGIILVLIVFWHDICYHYTRNKYKKGDVKSKIRNVIKEIRERGPEKPRNKPYFDVYLSQIDLIFASFRSSVPALFRSEEYIIRKQGKARRRVLEALEKDYRKYVDYV